MFYYFRFIRLQAQAIVVESCFHLMISLMNLLCPQQWCFFLFFCLTKCLRCLLNVHTELHSIYFLLLIITFILLLTVHLYNEDLNLVTFLSFCVDSINIKRNLLCKFINKSYTSLYGPLIFVYHFFFFFFHNKDIIIIFWRY